MLVTIHTGNQVLRVAKTDGDDDDPSLRPRSFEIRPGRGTQLMMAGYRPRCNTGMTTDASLPEVPFFCEARNWLLTFDIVIGKTDKPKKRSRVAIIPGVKNRAEA